MNDPFHHAYWFVQSLTGYPETAVMDWRAIHDTNKEVPAIPMRGTLPECWASLQHYNQQGYGIFANVSAMDGTGHHLENVSYIRAHCVDLDNQSAAVNFDRAAQSQPTPTFAVNSSPGKFHVYWVVQPYVGNDRFQNLQRRLRQFFDGDRSIIDASRVLRVPGTYHQKNPSQPHLVTFQALGGYGQQSIPVETLESAYQHVNVIDGGHGNRHPLGSPEMAAPSLEWLQHALTLIDPNTLDRFEWIAITSAIKQSGWSLTTPEALFAMWSEWCERYSDNDAGENLKQWNSIRETELGWKSLQNRVPSLKAAMMFQNSAVAPAVINTATTQGAAAGTVATPPPLDCSGEYLTDLEQREWFKGCTFVTKLGKILTPAGRFLNATQFNGEYGGKKFIIDGEGKASNEPWVAALRSTLWTIPKVDHIRFVPSHPHGELIVDDLGRIGVNMYKPREPDILEGDPSPFINHIRALIPDEGDLKILFDYIAHNIKYPGHKIPWAPVIQSTEGAGKGVVKHVMAHALGRPYVYFPNAKELTNSGSQFNGWMRNKLFIVADEIKVDDRRDLIEVLKPMISEEVIEIQSKGVDQELEDNFSNWCFFTNYKDAVPVNANARRYAIFFSVLQTMEDKHNAGMNDAYFNSLYRWLKEDGGAQIVTNYFLNHYQIERGAIPMDAPRTTSFTEAVKIGRSPVERVLAEAIEDQLPGFKGGWVSMTSALEYIRNQGVTKGKVAPYIIETMLTQMGYVAVGKAPRAYFQESGGDNSRSLLFRYAGYEAPEMFAVAQGWE